MEHSDRPHNHSRELMRELGIQAKADLARVIDLTNVKMDARFRDIEKLCGDAMEGCFRCVCVNPCWIGEARRLLAGTKIGLSASISFPFGTDTTQVKIAAVEDAISSGATEVDVMINIGFVKDKREKEVFSELVEIVRRCKDANPPLTSKIIVEAAMLDLDEKRLVCRSIVAAGADFVKTSTGFGPNGGATIDDVGQIRRFVGRKVGIKASGGIRSLLDALRMLKAGANVIGTSRGRKIIEEMTDL